MQFLTRQRLLFNKKFVLETSLHVLSLNGFFSTKSKPLPVIKRMTKEELAEYSQEFGFVLQEQELETIHQFLQPSLQALDLVYRLPDHVPKVKYSRTPGRHDPVSSENAHNAWAQKFEIKGNSQGQLTGKNLVVKDNIQIAGIPMMNGCMTLDGFVPEVDATVIQRVLDAGVTIKGTAHCESLCLSGGSHTNSKNPVINPRKNGYSSGGSSSGSACLVGLNEVDLAIGGDQGGSIRIPSSWCGTYGMKPTWSLVPYTGIMPIEPTLDHCGPITNNVFDNAVLLSVLAGRDDQDVFYSNDFRQQYSKNLDTNYSQGIDQGIKGMKIGVLKEGFGHRQSEKIVDEKVREAIQKFQNLGAIVEEVSIPDHLYGGAIFTGIVTQGLQKVMMEQNSMPSGVKGLYSTSLMKYHGQSWRRQPNDLSKTLKCFMLLSKHLDKYYDNQLYAKSQNLSISLTKSYDKIFQKYDIIAMPTLPMKAPKLPDSESSLMQYIVEALNMISNTCPFDVTGHPAMSIPCGTDDGLPIGLQLVGKHFDEKKIYKAAFAFEKFQDWKKN